MHCFKDLTAMIPACTFAMLRYCFNRWCLFNSYPFYWATSLFPFPTPSLSTTVWYRITNWIWGIISALNWMVVPSSWKWGIAISSWVEWTRHFWQPRWAHFAFLWPFYRVGPFHLHEVLPPPAKSEGSGGGLLHLCSSGLCVYVCAEKLQTRKCCNLLWI